MLLHEYCWTDRFPGTPRGQSEEVDRAGVEADSDRKVDVNLSQQCPLTIDSGLWSQYSFCLYVELTLRQQLSVCELGLGTIELPVQVLIGSKYRVDQQLERLHTLHLKRLTITSIHQTYFFWGGGGDSGLSTFHKAGDRTTDPLIGRCQITPLSHNCFSSPRSMGSKTLNPSSFFPKESTVCTHLYSY